MPDRLPRQVYLLTARQLSPETIAVTFAKTSRSPQSFRQIAAALSEETSAEFHEKWVLGYGHASVAEHAILHLAFENVSRLAVETIESNRLASYTEKSTRYQTWDPGSFHVPAELTGTPHEAAYCQTCEMLFSAYRDSVERVASVVRGSEPRGENESEERYDSRIRTRYVDACRYLLPAASLANVGMTVNARALEHALQKMLSSRLAEVRSIGAEVKAAAMREVPTLLKYAGPSEYLSEPDAELMRAARAVPVAETGDWLRLTATDPQGEVRVLAAALYAHSGAGIQAIEAHVERLDAEERRRLAGMLLGRRGRFDAPLRALEHQTFSAEVVLDQGAYFELKRHRLMTQTPQCLTADLGYAIPRLLVEAGLESAYHSAMQAAAETYRALAAWNPDVAAYVAPNGFNRRVLMTFNLREAYHLIELRSASNAHFAMRRVALRLAEELQRATPLLASWLRLPDGADWRQIEAEHFARI
jgi:thymidylate synthase ThyX